MQVALRWLCKAQVKQRIAEYGAVLVKHRIRKLADMFGKEEPQLHAKLSGVKAV
jgi:hypothetical protein